MSPPVKGRVPLTRPAVGLEEEAALGEVLRSGWISQGPKVLEFENALADYLRSKYVRAVNSGTSALMLALKAIGLGPGDSVVVPAFTCAASALPVLALGARAVFADIELATFNTTWAEVEQVLRPDTKAVILVHLFGRMADAGTFARQCEARGIALIEDAALALGATQAGRCAGTFGVSGCFSFHPRKMITTGEGGAVCSDDPAIAGFVETDRSYGAAASAWDRFQENVGQLQGFQRLAFNMKLTDIQAAMGIVQLRKLPAFIARRRQIAARYREAFSDVAGLYLPAAAENPEEDMHQAFVCAWQPEPLEALLADPAALDRAAMSAQAFRSEVARHGIAVSDAAQFLPELPVFRQCVGDGNPRELFPNAHLAAKLAFALPMFPNMVSAEIGGVVRAIRDAARTTVC